MVSLSTITPRSITVKPLHPKTMAVMFLPMSCTSPFTVAITTFGLTAISVPPGALSMYGWSMSTACFITFADLTTCGRNIFPSPKRRPTRFIPSISGPSIMLTARPYAAIQAARSSSSVSVLPFTRASASRSSGVAGAAGAGFPPSVLASAACALASAISAALAMSRSVAPSSESKITSSTQRSRAGSMPSYIWSIEGLTIAMSSPALIAW